MCLIALDYWRPGNDDDNNEQKVEAPSLLLASNRDEIYARPSQAAQFWNTGKDGDADPDADDDNGTSPRVYGGRDKLLGGSWLAVSTNGRLAAVTNYHNLAERDKIWRRSRGYIVSTFVGANASAKEEDDNNDGDKDKNEPQTKPPTSVRWSHFTAIDFCKEFLFPRKDDYAGFSALLFDGTQLVSVSNRDTSCFYRVLEPGLYGLSNHLLNTPWPKTLKAKAAVAAARKVVMKEQQPHHGLPQTVIQQLLNDFADTTLVSDHTLLPDTLSLDEEHVRSALCVRGSSWGTRTTTLVYIDGCRQICHFIEKNHNIQSSGLEASFTEKCILLNGYST
jgi:uncharacterized protein with NRDE domain